MAQIAAPVLRFQNTLATESFQQDVRVTSAAGTSFDWLAGLFYFQSKHERGDGGNRPMWLYDELSDDPAVGALHQALFNFPAPLPFATQGQIGTLDGAQDTDYVSVYGHTTWRPSRRFALNTGLRWQDEQKDAHVIQGTNDPAPSVISLILAPAVVSASGLHRDTRELTWSVTPQWFATDTTMLFATLAHGFKSGGFNIGFGRLPIADREFQDEDVEHFEIGVKSELADGRVRLAASAFQTDYNDYQDAAFVGTQFTVGNAEKVELDGVEVDGTAVLTPGTDSGLRGVIRRPRLCHQHARRVPPRIRAEQPHESGRLRFERRAPRQRAAAEDSPRLVIRETHELGRSLRARGLVHDERIQHELFRGPSPRAASVRLDQCPRRSALGPLRSRRLGREPDR